jgi:hypothetical protein
MFEDVAGGDDIEAGIGNFGHGADIQPVVTVPALEIGCYVFGGGRLDAFAQLAFGGKVEDFLSMEQFGFAESGNVRFAIKAGGKHAMPHLTAAVRADGTRVPAIVGKSGTNPPAHIACDGITAQGGKQPRLGNPRLPGMPPISQRPAHGQGNHISQHAGRMEKPSRLNLKSMFL